MKIRNWPIVFFTMWVLSLFGLTCLTAEGVEPESPTTNTIGFVELYNKRDLTGWQTKGNWLPQEDGSLLIQPREKETGWGRFDSYLWCEKQYADFELEVEFAYPENGNSGIYFRVDDRNNPVKTGIEAQVIDSSKQKGKWSDHTCGGIVPAGIAPSKNMALPPGQWNKMVVRCVGSHLIVQLNGTEVVNLHLSDTSLKDRPTRGYIGLQDHGRPHTIRFRNIRIREIEPTSKASEGEKKISAVPPHAAVDSQLVFAEQIKPIFLNRCTHCHGENEQQGSLRLDSLASIMRGGGSGEPTVVVGDEKKSHLIHVVTSKDKAHRMPLEDEPLSEREIESLRQWVRLEKGWDAAIAEAKVMKSDHWSFKPIVRPQVPKSVYSNPIDVFIAAKLDSEKLQMSPEAEPGRLIRRLHLVTQGLPATPERTAEFLTSAQPNKWLEIVDEVLDSPQYAERFATTWLDLIRFSETDGFEVNAQRYSAWRYRDWVIKAFAADVPYDQFIVRQLAGDVSDDPLGTGYLVAGPHNAVIEKDEKGQAENVQNEVSDLLNTVGTSFLGLTVGCARCHNHKFDPISQKDFYAIQAVFSGVNHGLGSVPPTDGNENELRSIEERLEATREALVKHTKNPKDLREPLNFVRNVETFPATTARFVRMTIEETTAAQACIDELEIYSGSTNVALAKAGAKAISGGDFRHPLHKLEHINDGKFGNSFSWIASDVKGWVQIELAATVPIQRVVWGRDRTGIIADRLATKYRIEVSADGETWKNVADSQQRHAPGTKVDLKYDDLASPSKEFAKQQHNELNSLLAKKKELEHPTAYIGQFSNPKPTYRLYRGEPMSPRELITPDTIALLGKLELDLASSGPARRLAFANWVASKKNPLTARVMVNRIWQFHFGEGLVSTPGDFGVNGSPPSHPELLDWLASEFMENNWSIKHIHRLILNSQTWRQDSRPRSDALTQDAKSRLLWRFPPRRLEAEAIRDSILSASGKLDLRAGGPGYSAFEVGKEYVRNYAPKSSFGPEDWRRMVYMTRVRREVESVFGLFDCPDGNQVLPKRNRSTTPLQALNLLNSEFVLQQAEFLAERLKSKSNSSEQWITHSYSQCFGRQPAQEEAELAKQIIEKLGLVQYCRILLNSNEFVFVL